MEFARALVRSAGGNAYQRFGWLTHAEQAALLERDLQSLEPVWNWSGQDALIALVPAPFDTEHLGIRVASLVTHCCNLDAVDAVAVRAARDALAAGSWPLVTTRLYEPDDHAVSLVRALAFRPSGQLLHLVVVLGGTPQPLPEHFEVRPAIASDEPAVRSLAARFYANRLLEVPMIDHDAVRRLYGAWAANDLTGRMSLNLVATVAGQTAGFLSAGVRHAGEPDGDIAVVDLVVVDPAHRRRGVARGLLAQALPLLAAQGASRAEIGVSDVNTAARALYSSLGFEHLGTSHDYLRSAPT